MEKIFLNYENTQITAQQAAILGHYYVHYFELNELRLSEFHYNHELVEKKYFLKVGETHQELIDLFYDPAWGFSIVEKEFFTGGCILHRIFSYDSIGLVAKRNELFDQNNDLIGHERIGDLLIGEPIFDETRKYYFDRSINSKNYLFECCYEENGSLLQIYFNNEHLNETGMDDVGYSNTPENILEVKEITGMSQELLDYYLSPYVTPNFGSV